MPPDGLTPEEEMLQKAICDNTVYTLYQKLPTSRMKFLVAAHYELGYTQEMLAEILGMTQPAISQELKYIKDVFVGKSSRSKHGKAYNPRKMLVQPKPRVEDVMKALMVLTQP